ncbi:hypothetical protein WJX74_007474 [Apatococcus lobatus]|uniref:Ketoreductase domain-containing protein n=2 Tax=Apatococcus TaxID=904362 RepID=A0AAW1T6B2_9CHLO
MGTWRSGQQQQGKTYLVTGSTDGIGQHTALNLARAGGNVIIHGRSSQRVDASRQRIEKAAAGGWVKAYTYDLSSMASVRDFAAAVRHDVQTLNVLLNNAGVFEQRMSKTVDGFEMTWSVNVMAPFLFTSLLLDSIQDRIVNVSSISAGSSVDFSNLQQEKGFSSHGSYALSKIAMMAFTAKLAKRLQKQGGPTVNCLDPGTVNTKMLEAGWGMCGMPVSAANGETFLATDPCVKATTGEYFNGNRVVSMRGEARKTKVQDRLWTILEQQTGAVWPQQS